MGNTCGTPRIAQCACCRFSAYAGCICCCGRIIFIVSKEHRSLQDLDESRITLCPHWFGLVPGTHTDFMSASNVSADHATVTSQQPRIDGQGAFTARDGVNFNRDAKYSMRNTTKGLCVIFNIEEFENQPEKKRYGSSKDVEKLKSVFTEMGLKAEEERNVRKRQLMEVLTSVSKKDHSNYDCLVICILSHGNQDNITSSDNMPIELTKLVSMFSGAKCPTLSGKPKLFFVQACKGDLTMTGVAESASTGLVSSDSSKSSTRQWQNTDIPDVADVLIGLATVHNYVSFRSGKKEESSWIGSWYIQSLCDMLDKYWERYDLVTILGFVNQEVAEKEGKAKNTYGQLIDVKQMPCFVSCLRKKMYFKNKA